jgi:predicted MFS family arabinose efflux permease
MHEPMPPFLTRRQVWTLTTLAILNHITFTGARVNVSLTAIHLGASELIVGLLVAFFSVLPALLSMKAGRMLDRVSPMTPLVASSVAHVAGAVVPFVVPGLWSLLAASLLIGTASNLFYLCQQRIFATASARADRTTNLGIGAIGFGVSGFIGPLATGVAIDHLGHDQAFLMLAVTPVIASVLLLAGVLKLPAAASAVAPAAPEAARAAFDLLRQPRVRRVYAMGLLFSMAWDTFTLFVPIHGSHAGLSATVIGMVMASLTAGVFTTRLALPAMARRISAPRLLFVGHIIIGAGLLVFPLTGQVTVLMACSFVVGLAVGYAQPLSMSMMFDVVPADRAGEALGLRIAITGASQAVFPFVLGAISSALGLTPVFWSLALLQFAGTRLYRRNHATTGAARK